ncbi:TOMM precursor leader peptide-binding protein [Actinopolymorpha rutila]|uniref:Ribosomal protein S12 methylthiotransferase accessory factor n=1 Tax=Actinopolymorpha rutila TaxID=446787 RepID=A0A852ZKE2_9ACTN|nr:TOMM precursor leader peptide-binding protein [Actinopolymorpha rutila]NYH89999.1 ribosomal protein S12 methylthiotransferase accessory factor [Actinopolymorpha rutila]
MERPQIAPHLDARVVDGDGAYLFTERGDTALRGSIYAALVPLLDGSRTVGEIVAGLRGRVSAPAVHYALARMERARQVVEHYPEAERASRAAFSVHGLDPAEAERRLAAVTVSVESAGSGAADLLAERLAALGLSVGADPGVAVVLVDDYTDANAREVARARRRDGLPVLPVRVTDQTVWCGPMLRPDGTPCLDCVAERIRGSRPVLALLDTGTRVRDGRTGPDASTMTLAAGLVTHDLQRWLLGVGDTVEDGVLVWDVAANDVRRHHVAARPTCEVCGDPGTPVPVPASRHLLRAPEDVEEATTPDPRETLDRFGRHVSGVTGIVTRLDRADLDPAGADHLYQSAYALPPPRGLADLRNGLRRTCVGKGATDVQARASALAEALERFSATFTGTERPLRASYDELGAAAVNPATCTLFSDRQYAARAGWSADAGYFAMVPPRHGVRTPIDWTPGYSLTAGETRYVPTGLCMLGHPRDGSPAYFPESSNGLAAGPSAESATLHALLELAERDAAAMWWYHRLRRPGVDWASFGEPYVARVADSLGRAGRELWVLDLTHDLGLPVMVAVSRRVGQGPEHVVLGFGCHPDPGGCLVKAVSELTQMLAWLGAVGPAEKVPRSDLARPARRWLSEANVAGHPYLLPAGTEPVRRAEGRPSGGADRLGEMLTKVRERIEAAGLEIVAVNLTRPEVGMPVVRVVVPGLRPLWPRFAPGRLYDVPVALGWLPSVPGEEDLNPFSMFL